MGLYVLMALIESTKLLAFDNGRESRRDLIPMTLDNQKRAVRHAASIKETREGSGGFD